MADRPEPPVPIVHRRGRPPSAARRRPVEIRTCKHHGEVEFGNYAAGGGRFKWICKKCIAEAVTRRHQKVRRMLIDEAGGCCAVCGYATCNYNLHFHHVDPSQKSFSLNSGIGKALATLRQEASKCVLVCANCHGEIETGLIPSPAPGTQYAQSPMPQGEGPVQPGG